MDNVISPLTPADIEVGFAESFAYQIALGMVSPKEVCQQFGVTKEEWNVLAKNDVFRTAVGKYRKEIDDEGVSTKRKAQIAADAGIADMVRLWRDPDQPASARVAAFSKVADIAGVTRPAPIDGLGTFGLTIILDGEEKAPKERVVESTNPAIATVELTDE